MKVEKHLTLKKVARLDIWMDRKNYKTFSFGDFYLKNQDYALETKYIFQI